MLFSTCVVRRFFGSNPPKELARTASVASPTWLRRFLVVQLPGRLLLHHYFHGFSRSPGDDVQIAHGVGDEEKVTTGNGHQIEKAVQEIEHLVRMQHTGDDEDHRDRRQENRTGIQQTGLENLSSGGHEDHRHHQSVES